MRFSPTFLRNATAFGVSPRLRFDLVLNNLVAWAFTTGKVFIKSDGTPWRPIVHIADISRAFIAVLQAPLEVVHNQAFNVARNEDNYRIRELADIVKETVPGCEIEYAKDAGPDKRCYRVDSGKILRRPCRRSSPSWDARKGAQELPGRLPQDRTQAGGFRGAEVQADRPHQVAHQVGPPRRGPPLEVHCRPHTDNDDRTTNDSHASSLPLPAVTPTCRWSCRSAVPPWRTTS